jgi:hypothetical protein
MEQKTKSFIWGTAAGAAVIVAAIVGLLTWGYFKGTAIQTEKSARQEKAVAEQVQQFGAVCSDAIPEAMAYFYTTLVPALNALQQGSFDLEQLPVLTQGVKNQNKFLSHCSGQVVSLGDDSSLKLSRRLMSASNEFASVRNYLWDWIWYPNQKLRPGVSTRPCTAGNRSIGEVRKDPSWRPMRANLSFKRDALKRAP